ncbi:MAG: glycosyltransferase [Burkholderiales bacterium]|nr:glycosyltransferase [Burkholderiales bacterium]
MNDRPRRRQACIDRIVLFANTVLAEGWCVPRIDKADLRIETSGYAPVLLPMGGMGRLERPDVVSAVQNAAVPRPGEAAVGFVATFDRMAAVDAAVTAETLWTLVIDGVDVAAFTGNGQFGDVRDESMRCVRLAAKAGFVAERALRLAEAAAAQFAGVPVLPCHVDAAARAGHGLGLDCWIANARRLDLVVMTDDFSSCLQSDELSFFSRPDVTAHLRSVGHAVRTDEHGVLAVFPFGGSSGKAFLVGAFEGDALVGHFVGRAEANADVGGILSRLNAVEGGGRFVPPEKARRLYRPFLAQRKPELAYKTQIIKEVPVRPELSIIVPFYKEDMFIRHLTTMQMWFADTVEWIFVCDDPSLKAFLETYLRKRAPLLRSRTRLVINSENYGYGRANNIGAEVADGEYLLFMNSDIWIDDVGPLERAVSALDEGKFGVIGFRLLYEDGTLQHDGLSFERHSDVHDLFIVDHPGKGLPPLPARESVVDPVPAATGALLMMSRELFLRVGGFDDRYIRGDFEDADLCLRIAELGLPTGIVREPGLFHLERQSIRLMGETSFREVVMYVNCITFNERWRALLEHDPSQLQAAVPRSQKRFPAAVDQQGPRLAAVAG